MSYRNQYMPFGKYEGCRLTEIPTGYLCWAVNNLKDCDFSLILGFRDELAFRRAGGRRKAAPPAQQPSTSQSLSKEVVATWFRTMSMEFHPDRGGSNDGMRAVNRGLEVLQELVS